MTLLERFYPESKIGGFSHVDGGINFYLNILAFMRVRDEVILDLGCGRGEFMDMEKPGDEIRAKLRNYRGNVKKVIGIDVDPAGKVNPSIDEFRLIEIGKPWPIEDSSIDFVVSDYVLEHLEDPDFFFSELNRVVKKGGRACFRTVNSWGYVAFAARLIPNRFHAKVTGAVQDHRKEEDVFPTFYRCNTRRSLKSILLKYGFKGETYTHEAEPTYFSFSSLLYALGFLYHKITPKFSKNILLAFVEKQ